MFHQILNVHPQDTPSFNPYKPSMLFVGHRQIVQTQIRRCRTRHLILVSTVCYNLNKNEKFNPTTHKAVILAQLIRVGHSIWLIWVKYISLIDYYDGYIYILNNYSNQNSQNHVFHLFRTAFDRS